VLLKRLHVHKVGNIVDSGWVEVEPDVTDLVGENESGKSTLLHALFRLNPVSVVHDWRRRYDEFAQPVTQPSVGGVDLGVAGDRTVGG
jgi:hypothetical protein